LRWYLTREVAFGQDGDFSWELFEKSYNADLANNLGNLVNRVTSMAHRYRGGVLNGRGVAPDLSRMDGALSGYSTALARLDLTGGAAAAMSLVDGANELIARREPWKLAKTGDDAALDAVLWEAAEACGVSAVLLSPYMPGSSGEDPAAAGRGARPGSVATRDGSQWQADGQRTLLAGSAALAQARSAADTIVNVTTKESSVTDQPISRIRTAPVTRHRRNAAAAVVPARARQPHLDRRVHEDRSARRRVTAAERVPNSKKLMKLSIDLGTEQRTVWRHRGGYEADALVGRHVVIVANLKAGEVMGIESNGMVLAASPDGGKPMLVRSTRRRRRHARAVMELTSTKRARGQRASRAKRVRLA
jgi:methionyl-tRNA synthetase